MFDKTALIIEGGAMRAVYSAGILTKLLKEDFRFPLVCGISAGSSLTANYILREPKRMKDSFVTISKDPRFGGARSMLKGNGFFNSSFIYHDSAQEGELLYFDRKKLNNFEGDFRIGATNMKTGKITYFSKKDMKQPDDFLKIVQASSSMPLFMPSTHFQGEDYVDGGVYHGIPLDAAMNAGYKRFIILLSRTRDYEKAPYKHELLIRRKYAKYPNLIHAILSRYLRYNKVRSKIKLLEEQKKAFVIYPKTPLKTFLRKPEDLEAFYNLGLQDGNDLLLSLEKFLLKNNQ